MKGKFLISSIAMVMATAAFAATPKVTVDGKTVDFSAAPPQSIKGRLMVPLRGVFEAIGAYVSYDSANRIVSAKKSNEEVELTVGQRIAKKNGAEILLDVAPTIINGTTMVPLRFIAEAMGAQVKYDKANNLVTVTTGSAAPSPAEVTPE